MKMRLTTDKGMLCRITEISDTEDGIKIELLAIHEKNIMTDIKYTVKEREYLKKIYDKEDKAVSDLKIGYVFLQQ